jgi:hypothetical protein
MSAYHTISKWCGVSARTQYKMNFSGGTSWKNGIVKWSNGMERAGP